MTSSLPDFGILRRFVSSLLRVVCDELTLRSGSIQWPSVALVGTHTHLCNTREVFQLGTDTIISHVSVIEPALSEVSARPVVCMDDLVRYGQAREGTVSALAVHFGSKAWPVLDSSFYGNGPLGQMEMRVAYLRTRSSVFLT